MPLDISEIGVNLAVGEAPARAEVSPSAPPATAPATSASRIEAMVSAYLRRTLASLRRMSGR